jgi:hypothetical protein
VTIFIGFAMQPSLGIFNEDLEDLTEGMFTSAYTELSNADAGTRSKRS